MRVAVISDIHGNLAALDAVLERARQLGADRVICLGDVVNPLPRSQEVFEYLESLSIPILRGNHEDYIVRCAENPDDPINRSPSFEPVRVLAQKFDRRVIERLKRLPMTLVLSDERAGECLLCHASPRNNRAGWRYGIDEEISAQIRASGARVLVSGHWHDPETRDWNGQRLVTIGSVGVPLRGKIEAEFLILESREGNWNIEHHSTPYDNLKSLAEFRQSGLMEEGGPITWLFHEEIRLAERRLSAFFKWANTKGRPIASFRELALAVRDYLQEFGTWDFVKPYVSDWLERDSR